MHDFRSDTVTLPTPAMMAAKLSSRMTFKFMPLHLQNYKSEWRIFCKDFVQEVLLRALGLSDRNNGSRRKRLIVAANLSRPLIWAC